MFNVDVNKKNLLEIQNALKDAHYDALIVPHEDEFLGEYISEDKQRLAFLLGFTGSAGSCVVYADNCIPTSLFVDGRYTIQARKQTPEEVEIKNFQSQLDTIHDAIANLKEGNTVAIDPRLHSMNWFNQAKSLLEQKQIKLVNCKKNFIDQIWRNKPETEKKPLIIFPAKYYGTPSTEKRERIAKTLKDRELDAMFIADSESVNWILNIRGHDIPYLPIVRCFAIIYSNQSMDVFIDNEKLITSQFAQQCGSDVSLFAFSKLEETLSRMGDDHLVVGYDEQKTNAYTVLKLQKSGATLIKIKDPCDIAKAVKTNVEIEGFRTAHVKDGVAMCRFLSWLDRRCSEKNEENCIFDALRAGDESVRAVARVRREDVKRFARELILPVRSERKQITVTAALMPEGAYDDTAFADLHYGQSYEDAAVLYDYVLPMAYSRAYEQDSAWVRRVAEGAHAMHVRTVMGLHAFEGGTGASLLDDIRQHPNIIVMGDFNAETVVQPAYMLNVPIVAAKGEADVKPIIALIQEIKPHQIYVAADLADPHGTHRKCTDAVLAAIDEERKAGATWLNDCRVWMYRGAWAEWDVADIEMCVPMSPEELREKRNAILRHQSQMESAPFLGNDERLFWQRAEDRNRDTAKKYDALGLACYEAMEAFVEYRFWE